jgi:hypothetical protein
MPKWWHAPAQESLIGAVNEWLLAHCSFVGFISCICYENMSGHVLVNVVCANGKGDRICLFSGMKYNIFEVKKYFHLFMFKDNQKLKQIHIVRKMAKWYMVPGFVLWHTHTHTHTHTHKSLHTLLYLHVQIVSIFYIIKDL